MLIINREKEYVLEKIKELESKIDGKLFFLCQSFGKRETIDVDLYVKTILSLKELGEKPKIVILLNSVGGDPDYAYKLINSFYRFTENLEVIITSRAKSAATLFSLGAKKIMMGKEAELGPIDTLSFDPKGGSKIKSALDSFKSIEYLRLYAYLTLQIITNSLMEDFNSEYTYALREAENFVSDIIRPLYEQVDPLELGEARRSLQLAENYANKIMQRYGYSHLSNKKIFAMVYRLVWSYPTHNFVIDYKEAIDIGLNIEILKDEISDICTDIIISSDGCFGFTQKSKDAKGGKK